MKQIVKLTECECLEEKWRQDWHNFHEQCKQQNIEFVFALRDNYGEVNPIEVVCEEIDGTLVLTEPSNCSEIEIDFTKSPIENLRAFWDTLMDEGFRDMFVDDEDNWDWDLEWENDIRDYDEFVENARWAMRTLNVFCTSENYDEAFNKLINYSK